MNIRDKSEITTLSMIKVAEKIDESKGIIYKMRYEDILKDLDELRSFAKSNPVLYKTMKSDFLHVSTNRDDLICNIFNKGYHREGCLFNTMLRCNNDLRCTHEYIKREKSNEIPPVFDDAIVSERLNENWILDLVKSKKIRSVNKILDDIKKEFSKVEDEKYIILTNGSTTCYQDQGMNILDINSIAYDCPYWFRDEFNYIIKRLNIMNFDMTLLETLSDDYIGGDIIHIPDKEFKIRSIFRMRPFVQIVSKVIHNKLDKVARRIEGNYTYDHRKWLYNIIDNDYHKDKYIITTDMSKYSDTLSNRLIFGILRECIDDSELVSQIEKLYTLSVIDTINGKIYSDPNGTYQGQYGDFPMITIINCILQRIVYYLSGQKLRKGYLAAVGDDTGFIFDDEREDALNIIIDIYGKAGVEINRDKTHILNKGEGYGDFVKLEICSRGIIPFINISNVYKQNVDGCIREIYDNYLIDRNYDLMKELFTILFGSIVGNKLTDLSIINGGVIVRKVTKIDMDIFRSRVTMLKKLSSSTIDELRVWLGNYEETLKENGKELKDTPFVGWSDIESYSNWIRMGGSNRNNHIRGQLLNSNYIGNIHLEHKFDIRSLEGWDLPEVYNKISIGDYDSISDEDILKWNVINSYETKEAIRNRDRKNRSKVSAYLTTLELLIDDRNDRRVYNYMEPAVIIKSYTEYIKNRNIHIIGRLINNILSNLSCVEQRGPYWGNYYDYIVDSDNNNVYRLYRTINNSTYDIPPKDVWERLTNLSYDWFQLIYNIEDSNTHYYSELVDKAIDTTSGHIRGDSFFHRFC